MNALSSPFMHHLAVALAMEAGEGARSTC